MAARHALSRRRPRALIACASFKGTLTSREAGTALARGLRGLGWRVQVVALADGGEGLVEALARSVPGARLRPVRCRGPLGVPVTAHFALLPARRGLRPRTAVIEMAASSGLPLVPVEVRDPKQTTTYGVGEQIRSALDAGVGAILLGLGGSATNDGGAGMAQALGARILDASGRPLPPGGAALLEIARIDITALDPRLKRVRVTAACDVRNPLCGRKGASAVFGPQKGASAAEVLLLDRALGRYAKVIRRDLGLEVSRLAGAGAAGGLGAGALAFLGARLRPGIELVLEAVNFGALLEGADLVLTGEGCLDKQTLMGKAPAGVAAMAQAAGRPCVAVGGGIAEEARRGLARRFCALEDLSRYAGSGSEARRRGAYWLARLARERGLQWLALVRGKGCGTGNLT